VSVCLGKTLSPAKTDKPIEMSFGVKTRMGLRNHVLDSGQGCALAPADQHNGMTCTATAMRAVATINAANCYRCDEYATDRLIC